MKRRKRNDICAGVPTAIGEPPASAALKKQSRYGGSPWKPGEIPTRSGALIPVHGALDAKPSPYGEFMGVEPHPVNRGEGYSPIKKVDLEGRETKRKQV